jgi:hypothetical protein
MAFDDFTIYPDDLLVNAASNSAWVSSDGRRMVFALCLYHRLRAFQAMASTF